MKPAFNFNVVQSGQRSTNQEPLLYVTSTHGGFRITPAVSTALRIAPGDNIMFLNTVAEVDFAISSKSEHYTSWCEEKGLDVANAETALAYHKEFDVYAIAKGYQMFNNDGTPQKASARVSMEAKLKMALDNVVAYEAQVMAAEDPKFDEVKAALVAAETPEAKAEILVQFVKVEDVDKYKGSRCGNPTGQTGIGLSLTFSDSSIWTGLKSDLKDEDRLTTSRVYSLNLENMITIELHDGHKNVPVSIIPLDSYKDEAVIVRGSDSAEVSTATETGSEE